MTRKSREKRDVAVTVHLTKSEKAALEKLTAVWDLDAAVIGRRLIQSLLRGKMSLPALLQKYRKKSAAEEPESRFHESRAYRVYIRMTRDEMRKLSALADEGFYFPGTMARILMELLLMGIIEQNDIWE
ncbi:MAG: hypothetical protein LBT65_01745 [Synergistaceae bacterium]|nr:hypothetical protein [Synergistaceae bacterium]